MERVPVDEMKVAFSGDETEAYVYTGKKAVLKLKDRVKPEEAPLYMNLETGEGYYPEGLHPGDADKAARKILDKKDDDILFHLRKDQDRWESEFREFLEYEEPGEAWTKDLEDPGDDPYF